MRKYKIGDIVTFTKAASDLYNHLIDVHKKHTIIGLRDEYDANGKIRQIVNLHNSRYDWADSHFMPIKDIKKRNLPDWF